MDSNNASYKQVACKIIKRKKGQKMDKLMKEVRILTALDHPSINRVYDVHNDESFLYIFLQLCTGGDLFSYIVNHKDPASRLHEGETKYIMYQLILGLKYLHTKSISHRGMSKFHLKVTSLQMSTAHADPVRPCNKPENILLYAPGPYPRIQIADFGLARRKSYEETFNVCGTVSYLPPEGILALENKDLGYVGMPADCWSAGVLLYIMLTYVAILRSLAPNTDHSASGHHPFDYGEIADESDYDSKPLVLKSWEEKLSMSYVRNDRRVRRRIVDDEVEFAAEFWDTLDPARTLCLGLLAYDIDLRWTIHDAFRSPWIQCDLDELASVYQRRVGDGKD
ncbi:kinase-like protein [Phanerochaete sordida]|uniref:Kinase-like protein n=1 Tax=Phanerochaete sordida TaxID=48140 RepID=A0A9P3G4T2_9APHY|nr:kinase-like protein [Phanerochaete sordida]